MSTEHGGYFQLTLNVNVVWKNIVPFGTFYLRIQLSSLAEGFYSITSKKLCRLLRPILPKRLKEFELLFLFLSAKDTEAKQPGLLKEQEVNILFVR